MLPPPSSLQTCNHILDLRSQRPVVVRGKRDAEQVLVAVDNKVRRRGERGVARRKRKRSHLVDGDRRRGGEVVVGDVQNGGIEDVAALEHLLDLEAILERLDSELGEKCRLGGSHLFADRDDGDIVQDLDLSLVNLRGDVERLEERRLRRVHAGVAGGHSHGHGSDDTRLGHGTNLVLANDGAHVGELALREDDADVADEEVEESEPLRLAGALGVSADRALRERVLSHEHARLAHLAERHANVGELLGSDEVGVHEEASVVLVEVPAQLGIKLFFLGTNHHFDSRKLRKRKNEKVLERK
mmetsp:Transcript_7046/g.16074  ORF Transcript_7046/g.16074 Transcript_7046/m.16074 type:complete len:300 (-) Transcript_7046:94-993(-)